MRCDFSKNEKLLKSSEFRSVFDKGKKYKGKYLILFYASNTRRKIGFVVSKKVSKKAVVRNKLKRRLREIYRTNKNCLPDNLHIVAVAMPCAAKVGYGELERDFLEICKNCFA